MDIRTTGLSRSNSRTGRRDGSISAYDSSGGLIAKWAFSNAWPSKIEPQRLDPSTNDPISEAVTLQYEHLEKT